MSTCTELVVKLTDLLECPVCLESVEDPRLLPCQHTFCFKCLEEIIGQGRTIRCPCCNEEATPPNGVSGLPVDFRFNNWLEILADYKTAKAENEALRDTTPEVTPSEELTPARCGVCRELLNEPVVLTCSHVLCDSCVGFLLPVCGTTLHCPTCSMETTIGAGEQTHDVMASGQGQSHIGQSQPEEASFSQLLAMLSDMGTADEQQQAPSPIPVTPTQFRPPSSGRSSHDANPISPCTSAPSLAPGLDPDGWQSFDPVPDYESTYDYLYDPAEFGLTSSGSPEPGSSQNPAGRRAVSPRTDSGRTIRGAVRCVGGPESESPNITVAEITNRRRSLNRASPTGLDS